MTIRQLATIDHAFGIIAMAELPWPNHAHVIDLGPETGMMLVNNKVIGKFVYLGPDGKWRVVITSWNSN
jgi:hypothetical protein